MAVRSVPPGDFGKSGVEFLAEYSRASAVDLAFFHLEDLQSDLNRR